jgi:hypothetical protein
MEQARQILREWAEKQGHDRCWYYPDLFRKLADVLGVNLKVEPRLPPFEEFKLGCERYQKESYEQDHLLPPVPPVAEDADGGGPTG